MQEILLPGWLVRCYFVAMRNKVDFRVEALSRSWTLVPVAVLVSAALLATVPVPVSAQNEAMDKSSLDESTVDEGYLAELTDWRQQREQRLRSENGWLALVGLFPLDATVNGGRLRFGSAETNELVFPDKAPARAGVLQMSADQVVLKAEPDAGLRYKGEPVTTLTLRSDTDGNETVIELGDDLSFYLIQRGDARFLRLKDSAAQALTDFQGLDHFPTDIAWRIEASYRPYNPPKKVTVPNVLGTAYEETCPGALVFQIDGVTYLLDPVAEEGQPLFIIFGDRTNGSESYGGGRFLYADPPDENGKVILDFNRAYNPPCAFTPHATCPLPPRQNKLPVRIEAGEKNYAGHVAH